MFDLSGKSALVAGGAGYLALPVCRGLLAHGANVRIADMSAERLKEAVDALQDEMGKERVAGTVFDISDEASVKGAVTTTIEQFGALDILINATWFHTGKALEALTPEEFDRSNRINLTGAFMLTREAADRMTDGGAMVFYSSMYGLVAPDPSIYEQPMNCNPVEYGAAKAGVAQMVRYFAAAYGPRNIRVNGIAPGPFPFPQMTESDGDFVNRLANRTMLGRIGKQDETAGPVVFLASDEAAYVTGTVLPVDGGWTAW
jgi:NAD(P)-dependent dehydrogenase (short-subunit alcohol dehydrogenase family)